MVDDGCLLSWSLAVVVAGELRGLRRRVLDIADPTSKCTITLCPCFESYTLFTCTTNTRGGNITRQSWYDRASIKNNLAREAYLHSALLFTSSQVPSPIHCSTQSDRRDALLSSLAEAALPEEE